MEQNGHRKELEELMAMVVNDMGAIAATPEGRDSTRTVILMSIASSLADIADVLCAGKENKEE